MRAYGHETDGVTAVPEEAASLAAAAKRLLEGGATLADTAQWMTETAGPTVFGRPWSPTTLRRRLRNPGIAGLRENADGELVKGPAEPLVDRDTFDALQELFTRNERGQGSKPAHVHLLSGGTAMCDLCDSPLVSRSTANGGRGYVCETAGCGKVRIAAEPLDKYVAERAIARLGRAGMMKRLADQRDGFVAESEEAARFLDGLRSHKDELARAFGAKDLSLGEFKKAKEALEARRSQAMAAMRRGKYLGELPELTVEALVEWWNETAGQEQRRALLQLIVAEVRVGPAAVRGSRRFDETRFDILWQ